MTILEKIKFEEEWLSEVNLTKENIKIAFAGIRATVLEQQPCEDCVSREDAIKEFQVYREYDSNRTNDDWVDRIELVLTDLPPVTPKGVTITDFADRCRECGRIKPCEDCISRQAVLDTEYQIKEINNIEYVMLSEVQMKIRKMPSVTPKAESEEEDYGSDEMR